jgi:hypothetical protein
MILIGCNLTSCRTLALVNSSHHFKPHEPCSYYSNPRYQVGNCSSFGQFFNFSYEQMNTNFSNPWFESNSNFYTPDWSNHSNFLWQAHAMGNYSPKLMNYTILNICSSTTNLPILHPTTINPCWKTLLNPSSN